MLSVLCVQGTLHVSKRAIGTRKEAASNQAPWLGWSYGCINPSFWYCILPMVWFRGYTNPLHFLKIILIAMRMPEVKFWLPTHEKKLVSTSSLPIPDNLTIRVTNPLIDPKVYEKRFPTQSEVRTTMDGTGFLCPASWGPIKHCGSCRACWDKTVPLITYRRH